MMPSARVLRSDVHLFNSGDLATQILATSLLEAMADIEPSRRPKEVDRALSLGTLFRDPIRAEGAAETDYPSPVLRNSLGQTDIRPLIASLGESLAAELARAAERATVPREPTAHADRSEARIQAFERQSLRRMLAVLRRAAKDSSSIAAVARARRLNPDDLIGAGYLADDFDADLDLEEADLHAIGLGDLMDQFRLSAVVIHALVAMSVVDRESPESATTAESPTKTGPAPEIDRASAETLYSDVKLRNFTFGSGLDNRGKLAAQHDAIETMLAALGNLLQREELDQPDSEHAEVIRDALQRLYRMESPPPVASTDGNLSDAARLLHAYSDPDPDLDPWIEELLAPRAAGDAAGLRGPLEQVLTQAAKRSKRDALRRQTLTGMSDGYRKLVAGVVIGVPIAAIDGIVWLTTHKSWLAAFVEFVISAAQ